MLEVKHFITTTPSIFLSHTKTQVFLNVVKTLGGHQDVCECEDQSPKHLKIYPRLFVLPTIS